MTARPRVPRRRAGTPERLAMTQTVVIENVQPTVDGGRYPAKSEVGELLEVSADIFKEGHDIVVAFVRYRGPGETGWREAPMHHVDNDRWVGQFPLEQNGRYVFAIEALADPFRSWLADLGKRIEAGGDVASELLEGRALVEAAARRARGGDARDLQATVERLAAARSQADAVAVAREAALATLMTRQLDRRHATRSKREYTVTADRERARFAAWYELFPRSARGDGLPATFKDAEVELERIAAMGFDVVYLPPIHPIGHSFRKGRNNALAAAPGEPGSPWAIGSEEGGHMAVHPQLGTLEDFDHFVEAAERRGLEVALDFAIQCSPDHPYVREHPEWFFHRPDGTVKYAENPPKRYQDIYPVNFYRADPRPLWEEMRRIVEFWIAHGVRAFRVDNPHTKPVPFWEWLITSIQRTRPDVIFLAEAFTRPKMMRVLAKVGFTQSYTYFTWRNDKPELIEYLEEITTPPVADYLRGHLWPNTPDILHETLQTGGRSAFKMRLVLAATLSSLYGIYSGYELGENVPAGEGSEEYLDSEKYEIKARDWNAPGNLVDFVATINRIRRGNRALHLYRNLRFYTAADTHIVWYGKMTPDRSNVVFVAANLDLRGPRASLVDVPLAELGLGPDEPYVMHELLSDRPYEWRGPRGYVVLDPAIDAAQIFVFHRT